MPLPPFSAGTPQATFIRSGKVKQTVYNVRDYGAKGDAQILTDGAISAGGFTFTSASNPFVLSDVGKMISIGDAANRGTSSFGNISSSSPNLSLAITSLGSWDASTNTPTLADGIGTTGDYYSVSVAGTQNLGSGSQTFAISDHVIYDGAVWHQLAAIQPLTFSALDVGKPIKVTGAGAGGTDLLTTISTLTDGTHVVLAVNASTTVTNVIVEYGAQPLGASITGFTSAGQITIGTAAVWDVTGSKTIWGTDDAAAINSTFTVANAAGGGSVFFPTAIYACGDSIVPLDNVECYGASRSAVTLIAVAEITNHLLYAQNTLENFYIHDITLDANNTVNGSISIRVTWFKNFNNLTVKRVTAKNSVSRNFTFGNLVTDEATDKSQNLIWQDCIVDGHSITTLEPSILVDINNFEIDNIQFLNVTSTSRKIYFYMYNRHGVIKNMVFDQDQEKYMIMSTASDLSFEDCTFIGNTINQSQLTITNSIDIKINNCDFNNLAGQSAGIIHYDQIGPIDGNWPVGDQIISSDIIITNSNFNGLSAGIFTNNQNQSDKYTGLANIVVIGCIFENYTSSGITMGIGASSGTLESFKDFTVLGNQFKNDTNHSTYAVRLTGMSSERFSSAIVDKNTLTGTVGSHSFLRADYTDMLNPGINQIDTTGTSYNITNDTNTRRGLIVSPSSSTDTAIVRFDGTTGELAQNSTVTLDNNGVYSNVGNIMTFQDARGTGSDAFAVYTDNGSGTQLERLLIRRGAVTTLARLLNAAEFSVDSGSGTGNMLKLTSTGLSVAGNLTLNTTGGKLNITTGSNASVGTGTLSGGTVTITTTAVTASSLIFLTDTSNGANLGIISVGTIVASTSFVVNSSNVLDSGTFNYLIIN